MKTTVYRQIQQLSRHYFDPHWAMTLMMNLIKSKEKLTKKILTKIYLQRLLNKSLGTTPVEKMTLKMLGGKRDETIVKRVMKKKVDDAEKEEEKARVECSKCRVEYNSNIVRGDYANAEFEANAREVVESIWHQKMNNIKKSIRYKGSQVYSSRKYRSKNVGIEGIKVTDEDLKDVPEEMEELAVVYGGVCVSENVKKALKVHPKFMTYDDLKIEAIETEIEKGMMKSRYSQMGKTKSKEGDDNQAEESETQEDHKIFDVETGIVNYSLRRVTEYPTVRRLIPPTPACVEIEASMLSMKELLLMKTREYLDEFCDNKGRIKESNLSKEVRTGIKEIKCKIKAGEGVVFTTDKSSRLSMDSVENYNEALMKHVQGDSIADEKEVDKAELEMSRHSAQWAKMLKAGAAWGHESRVKQAVTSSKTTPPNLYCLRKDHKPVEPGQEDIGPKTRPVAGVVEAPNSRLGHSVADLINKAADLLRSKNVGRESKSTEEMVAAISKYNLKMEQHREEEGSRKLIIGSIDVKALYPSLQVEETVRIVVEMVKKSGIIVAGADWVEVGKYLALNLSWEEVETSGLVSVVPKRNAGLSGKPTMAYLDGGPKNKKNPEKWNNFYEMPSRAPTEAEQTEMIAKCVEIAAKLVMRNHFYLVGEEIRKQAEGGPIGLELTTALARMVMVWCDEKFLERARRADIKVKMLDRYVDDSNLIIEVPPKGTRYDVESESVVYNRQAEIEDNQLEDDRRTMALIREVADSVHPMLKFEEDFPSNHEDGRIPILDLKCWMDDNKKVWYEHYEKPVATTKVLHSQSALAWCKKRDVAVSECVRRLRNCSLDLPWQRKAHFLSNYMGRLKQAGYNEKFRCSVLDQAMARFEGMVKAHMEGTHPMYRDSNWDRKARNEKKQKKKTSWAEESDGIIFVQATPNGELARRFRQVVENYSDSVKFRVEEKGGRSMQSMLQCTNPSKRKGCSAANCFACSKGKGEGGDCRKTNVGYEIGCDECEGNNVVMYVGETSRNAYIRGQEHIDAYRRNDQKSPLWKHAERHHGGRKNVVYSMKIVNYFRDPLTRQVNEGVRINRSTAEVVLNSKSEWHGPATARLTIDD